MYLVMLKDWYKRLPDKAVEKVFFIKNCARIFGNVSNLGSVSILVVLIIRCFDSVTLVGGGKLKLPSACN